MASIRRQRRSSFPIHRQESLRSSMRLFCLIPLNVKFVMILLLDFVYHLTLASNVGVPSEYRLDILLFCVACSLMQECQHFVLRLSLSIKLTSELASLFDALPVRDPIPAFSDFDVCIGISAKSRNTSPSALGRLPLSRRTNHLSVSQV